MDYVFFEWGPFAVTAYSFFFTISVIAGLLLFYHEGMRKGINVDRIISVAIASLLGGMFGARAAYVLFVDMEYYRQNLEEIFSFQDGGLSFMGGLVGALLAAQIFSAIAGFSLKQLMDAAAPALALSGAISLIGFSSEGEIVSSGLPWAIESNSYYAHPEQAYMIILLYLLFLVLWQKRTALEYQGQLFTWFLIGYGGSAFIVDFFSVTPEFIYIFSLNQIFCLLIMGAGAFYMVAVEKSMIDAQYRFTEELTFSLPKIMFKSFMFAMLIVASVYIHLLLHQ